MGVAKGWRFSGKVFIWANHNLDLVHTQNGGTKKQDFSWKWSTTVPAPRRPIRWSLVCGVMLFVLGLISLFTGHIVSDLEWYSQRLLVKRSWYYKLVNFTAYLYLCIYWSMLVLSSILDLWWWLLQSWSFCWVLQLSYCFGRFVVSYQPSLICYVVYLVNFSYLLIMLFVVCYH